MPEFLIRDARLEDCPALGRVLVAATCDTFQGLVPDKCLEWTLEESATNRARNFEPGGSLEQGEQLFVAETEAGEVVRLALLGDTRAGSLRDPQLADRFPRELITISGRSGLAATGCGAQADCAPCPRLAAGRRQTMTSQRLGKYACLELERRYLLRQLPHDLQDRENGWLIEDRYVAGTRLRLRRMSALGGGEVLYKFGQKYRAPFQSAAETTMTNMYLDEGEYDRLRQLEANTLVKKRLRYDHEGRPYGIDVFEGRLEGLILAETECETIEEYERLPLPPFAHIDVTAEPFYTGGHLATLSRKAFQETLARWL